MWEGLAGQARKALQLAHEEARRKGFEYVGTEHLFLGTLREGSERVVLLLAACGVNPIALAREAEDLLRETGAVLPALAFAELEQLPLTPSAKRALEHARTEAQALGHSSVGPEHLLVGLVCETEGVAAAVLERFGLAADRLRQELARMPPPDNRDWLLRPQQVSGPSVSADPSAQDLGALMTGDPLPPALTGEAPPQRPARRDQPVDAELLRRLRRGGADAGLAVVEKQLRTLQFLVAAIGGAIVGGRTLGVGGAVLGGIIGAIVAAAHNHFFGALVGLAAGAYAGTHIHGVGGAPLAGVLAVAGAVLGWCLGDWRKLPSLENQAQPSRPPAYEPNPRSDEDDHAV